MYGMHLIVAYNDLSPKVQNGQQLPGILLLLWVFTHLHVIWHQDLAGLLDHWLGLELLFTEGVPPGVEVLLAAGHGDVRRIHVKHSNRIWSAARGRQQRRTGGRGGGRRWLTGLIHTCLTPWNHKEEEFVSDVSHRPVFTTDWFYSLIHGGADGSRPLW